jgi:regulatory protein
LYTILAAIIVQPLIHKKFTPKEARAKIAKYCAYQERCHQEVRDKLYGYGLASLDVEHIIAELIEQNFVNEERYALAYARGKFTYKKWGRNRIVQELQRKKISTYCIKKGLLAIEDVKYMEVLTQLLQNKINTIKNAQAYQKNYKAAQFVIAKGYESDLVWSIINEQFK